MAHAEFHWLGANLLGAWGSLSCCTACMRGSPGHGRCALLLAFCACACAVLMTCGPVLAPVPLISCGDYMSCVYDISLLPRSTAPGAALLTRCPRRASWGVATSRVSYRGVGRRMCTRIVYTSLYWRDDGWAAAARGPARRLHWMRVSSGSPRRRLRSPLVLERVVRLTPASCSA